MATFDKARGTRQVLTIDEHETWKEFEIPDHPPMSDAECLAAEDMIADIVSFSLPMKKVVDQARMLVVGLQADITAARRARKAAKEPADPDETPLVRDFVAEANAGLVPSVVGVGGKKRGRRGAGARVR